MKHSFKRALVSIVLAITMLFPYACTKTDNNENDNTSIDEIEYSVTVLRSGGDPFEDVLVYAKSGSKVAGFGKTDKTGKATFKAAPATYSLSFSNLPEGYSAEGYTVTAEQKDIEIKLSTSLISEPAAADQKYTFGSVMHDFSFVDSTGKTGSLSNTLKTKKAIILNFWYTTCSACVTEFPDMEEAYNSYSDKVEIIALNPFNNDDEIEAFRQNSQGGFLWKELPFTMVGIDRDDEEKTKIVESVRIAFGVDRYPTTIVIDREGVVCDILIGVGYKSEFTELFKTYTAEPYVQHINFPKTELDAPDVEAPSSAEIEAAINNTQKGFDFGYTFDEDPYNWPWVVGSKDGQTCIYPANSGHSLSYAIMYCNVTATAGQAIVFDYYASTEYDYDIMYVFVDDLMITQISGEETGWKTCYAYIPDKPGTYSLSLAYVKDASRDVGDDKVYVKNMRFEDASTVPSRTEMIYPCTWGDIDEDTDMYANYATVVYSDPDDDGDGYYHVGDKNGPLVLADLLNGSTHWNKDSAWSLVSTGNFIYDGVDYTETFTDFCMYANNSRKNGILAVTKELKECLDALTKKYGNSSVNDNENEWLELCYYYKIYGGEPDEQLKDPVEGIAYYAAYDIVANDPDTPESELIKARVKKETILMPRGMWFKFVPDESAVYNVKSMGEIDSYCWLANANREIIAENDDDELITVPELKGNFSLTWFGKKGETYYILCDFNNVNTLDEYDICLYKVAESGTVWTSASSGYYTVRLDGEELTDELYLVGAVDYYYDDSDNDVYRVKVNGSESAPDANDPVLYVNLGGFTQILPADTIASIVNRDYYYCKKCGAPYYRTAETFENSTDSQVGCATCGAAHGKADFEKNNMFTLPTAQRTADGIRVIQYVYDDEVITVPRYELDTTETLEPENYKEDLATYGIKFEPYYDIIADFVDMALADSNKINDDNEIEYVSGKDHIGFVPATGELVDVLQKFILYHNYSFIGIDNAWLMLANYYYAIG